MALSREVEIDELEDFLAHRTVLGTHEPSIARSLATRLVGAGWHRTSTQDLRDELEHHRSEAACSGEDGYADHYESAPAGGRCRM